MTLFLHGFTGAPQSGDELLAALGTTTGWEAPWLYGHGQTPDLDRSTSFEAEVRYLLEHSSSRVCVGYSLGSRLALAMAILAPERFDRLVLIGVHPGLGTEVERESRRRQDEAQACSLETDGLQAFVDRWQALPLFDEERLPARARATRRSIRLGHTASGLAAALRVLGLGQMPAYKKQLSKLPATHIVVGERDEKFRALADELFAPCDAKIHVIPDAGHDALLWAPQRVARILAS